MVAATRIAPLPEEIDDKKRQFHAGDSDPENERIVAETPEDESNGRQSLHEPILPVNFESDAEGGCRRIAAALCELLAPYGGEIDLTGLRQYARR